jgi:hypothetical protein
MSLASLLDIHQPQDLLRGLLNTITEYDQSKEEGEKSKMVRNASHSMLPLLKALPSPIATVQVQGLETRDCDRNTRVLWIFLGRRHLILIHTAHRERYDSTR